jgi:hypothetical protein
MDGPSLSGSGFGGTGTRPGGGEWQGLDTPSPDLSATRAKRLWEVARKVGILSRFRVHPSRLAAGAFWSVHALRVVGPTPWREQVQPPGESRPNPLAGAGQSPEWYREIPRKFLRAACRRVWYTAGFTLEMPQTSERPRACFSGVYLFREARFSGSGRASMGWDWRGCRGSWMGGPSRWMCGPSRWMCGPGRWL